MHSVLKWSFAAALAGLPVAAAAMQSDPELVLRAVRFYRAEQDLTRVKGIVQIPYALVQRTGEGSAYTVSVRVADATGLTLYQQSWQSKVAAGPAPEDAYAVEIVDFTVAPGTYKLEVAVGDSASGKQVSQTVSLEALGKAAKVSDLLASPAIRVAAANDTVPKPGEFRAGNNLVTAAARVFLTPLRAHVYYLMEAYSPAEQKGKMGVSINDSAGKAIVQTPPLEVTVAPGGSMLKGQLDLTGLPPGDYTMTSRLELGGETIERSAPITMAPITQTLVRDSAARQDARITDEGYFAAMSVEELDQAKEPLAYVARSRELSSWDKSMSAGVKRKFLTEFWKKRDPTPDTPRNERREQFYQAIAYADKHYREPGRRAPDGWRTDRGRIFAKNGTPDDVLQRPEEAYGAAFEVWKYTRGKARYYIFADRTGFGGFQLIYSNDVSEPKIPAWGAVLSRRGLAEAGTFLGVDLFSVVRSEDAGNIQRF
jgi:GWxTD domain-containing protein